MRYLALATDCDGTLARDGVASPAALDAIRRMRETGRRAILVTGRTSSPGPRAGSPWSHGSLGTVSVGTMTDRVGTTGDTNASHLHFEYHPGGGAAVDPYDALRAVC
jgi:ribonucleotide monophosphatase NagD (HAD superfamily)